MTGPTMRIGINLPNYGARGTVETIAAIGVTAEQLGYTSLWVTDHVLMPDRLPEPYGHLLESLTTLTYLAALTSRITLATSVIVLPQRDPILLAKRAATLEHLSGGRLTLGVGVGWVEEEYRFLRADFRRRGRLADEYLQVMRQLWTADKPRYTGEQIQFDKVLFSPRPPRPGGIPIVVGGGSPAALTRAARYGDGWHAIAASPATIRAARTELTRLAPDRHLEISLRISTMIDSPTRQDDEATSLAGSPHAIADRINAYWAAGVDEIVLDFAADDRSAHLEQLHRFAGDVRPLLIEAG
jgi:probable F420-dependent oxidoreductase